jgi:cullin 4
MQTSIGNFTRFYCSERKDRKLLWAHSLGTVTLITRFPSGEKELSLSLHQAVVMLLFEDNVNKLKFSDILEETGIGTQPYLTLSYSVD